MKGTAENLRSPLSALKSVLKGGIQMILKGMFGVPIVLRKHSGMPSATYGEISSIGVQRSFTTHFLIHRSISSEALPGGTGTVLISLS